MENIWTLAAAVDEVPGNNILSCPCTNSKSHVAFTGLIPEFIGDDFYCETGSRTTHTNRYYLEDPLWDGRCVADIPVAVKGRDSRGSSKTYPSRYPVTLKYECVQKIFSLNPFLFSCSDCSCYFLML